MEQFCTDYLIPFPSMLAWIKINRDVMLHFLASWHFPEKAMQSLS